MAGLARVYRGVAQAGGRGMKRLNTNTLPTLNTNRVRTLEAKAGSTPRIRGDAWMAKRREVMRRDKFTCAACGAIRMDHEVDHRIPLEQGGTNDLDNLQLLCRGSDRCHAAKTKAEAKARSGC